MGNKNLMPNTAIGKPITRNAFLQTLSQDLSTVALTTALSNDREISREIKMAVCKAASKPRKTWIIGRETKVAKIGHLKY